MDFYLASILAWAPNFAPRNWAFCNGGLLSIAQNTALFSLLGNTYGGDGRTTFALPDLRGRVPVGSGQSSLSGRIYTNGEKGGSEYTQLVAAQMPAHTHHVNANSIKIKASSQAATANVPASGMSLAATASSDRSLSVSSYSTAAPDVELNAGIKGSQTTSTGGNQAVSLMQPFTVVNYIICTEGIFPPRD